MNKKKTGFVDIDQLQSQLDLETVCRFYGVDPGAIHEAQNEIRTQCFMNCGKAEPTGDRAVAFNISGEIMKWRCHNYGCGNGGNLVSLCGLLKFGSDGLRPRGDDFKAIRDDMVTMTEGGMPGETAVPHQREATTPAPKETKENIPLIHSDNERVRSVINLDVKFITNMAEMNPSAAKYFRKRPYFTPEMCAKWRLGYLPRNTGGDTAGGTMRGKVVYGYQNQKNEILTWFGRDPEHEKKHQKWINNHREGREPAKFHFVKGFHRGLQLFGEHQMVLQETREKIKELGLIIVEGSNDVIALDALDIPAVALCSNTITPQQTRRVSELAGTGGIVTLMLDCDEEGERGTRQVLSEVAKHNPVRLAWSAEMHQGAYRGRQPESLSLEEWEPIREFLSR